MEDILAQIGMTSDQLITLVTVAVVALVGLLIVRTVMKLTVSILRLGCVAVILGVIAMVVLGFVS